jgi:signal peptidase I
MMTGGAELGEWSAQDLQIPPDAQKAKKMSASKRALLIVGAILGGLLLVAFLGGFVLGMTHSSYYIPSKSMAPALEPGDRLFVDKGTDVSRGDIVVVHNPDASTQGVSSIVKRVIGLPGETVTIADDHVVIDGRVLNEPYLAEGTSTQAIGPHPCSPSDPCVIPDGDVWLMGDNRTDSKDSRYFGPVAQASVIGRADYRYWPLSRAGSL